MNSKIIKLSENVYRDKVMGCWLGKNAGGSLGMPHEMMWGNEKIFDVSFYTKMEEGGLPNDDLEIQLIWLMMLEDRGLEITCKDFAEYWMNHVGYCPDEYGCHKTNLRKGLAPPISGKHNNPFKDCMGCPIRSEIWACIAPGLPHVAAHYAWHDAVCDHAGGESVYGELFNAALQSAAFVISDRDTLLDIGLSVIPENCKTAQTIRIAREQHATDKTWLEARNAVYQFAKHPFAQHSPINLGFQTIGWLYGKDFGDSLCKAMNCGYDTDCTAATLGSILGIIHGAKALPEKWIKPLGNKIVLTPPPGIIHVQVPEDVDELTDRTIAITRQLLAKYHDKVQLVNDTACEAGASHNVERTSPSACEAGSSHNVERTSPSAIQNSLVNMDIINEILSRPQDNIVHSLNHLDVSIAYPNEPVISVSEPMKAIVTIKNTSPEPLKVSAKINSPDGFSSNFITIEKQAIPANKEISFEVEFSCTDKTKMQITNQAFLFIEIEERSAIEAVPIVMLGARRWLVSKLFEGQKLEDADTIPGNVSENSQGDEWEIIDLKDDELKVENLYNNKPGIIYLRYHAYNPEEKLTRVGVPNNQRMKIWINGKEENQTQVIVPCRPAVLGEVDPEIEWNERRWELVNAVDVTLPKGWNTFVIKLERGKKPIQAFFTTAYEFNCFHSLVGLDGTRFPWDAK